MRGVESVEHAPTSAQVRRLGRVFSPTFPVTDGDADVGLGPRLACGGFDSIGSQAVVRAWSLSIQHPAAAGCIIMMGALYAA
jgi:hypothetical protein